MARGWTEKILDKYRAPIRRLKDSRRKVVVAGLLPGYDGGSVVLSRTLVICSRVKGICRTEGDYMNL